MILGINDMVDPSISLVKDGKLLFYVEEERLNRIKHSHNIFPIKSIEVALKKFNISISDLDCIAYNWNFKKYSHGHMKNFFKKFNLKFKVDDNTIKWQQDRLNNRSLKNFKKKLELNLREKFIFSKLPLIKFFSHHYVHAFQSHFHSGFNESLCMTIDGSGEENCTVIWKCKNDIITKIKEINMPNSLGWYYAAFTEYLGFKAYDGEYKLMGLASYGKKNHSINEKLNKNPIDLYYFMERLGELSKKNDILITDAGSNYYVGGQVWKFKKGQKEICSVANAAMGLSVPLSIGAAVASPKSMILAVTGDGSLELNIQELKTISHNKFNIKLFVINNGGYVSMHNWADTFFKGRRLDTAEDTGDGTLNLKNIAKAFDMEHFLIHDYKQIDQNLKFILKSKKPLFIEVMTDTKQKIYDSFKDY